MKYSKVLQLGAGLVLAGAGLYIFFGKSGEGEDAILPSLVRELSNTSISAIALCAVLSILTLWLRSLRWHIMLPKCDGDAHKKGLLELQARDKLNSMTLECEAMLCTQLEICKWLVNGQGCPETTTDSVRPTLETCHFVYQNQE